MIQKMSLDTYHYLINFIDDQEELREPFKKSKAKDFVSNLETEAENLLMRCWEKAFSPDERELLQSRRKDQDYLDIVW